MGANDRVNEIAQLTERLKDKYPALMYLVRLTEAVDAFLPEESHG